MTPFAVLFPLEIHLDRFHAILNNNPEGPTIKAALDRLKSDPRPKDLHFEQIPPVEEAQFLMNKFGFALKEELPSLYLRALARCRIRAGSYWILYDVMDDLRIIWLFQVVKAT